MCCELELRQRDSEYGDHTIVDADLDGNSAGDSKLGGNHWCWLYDRWWKFAGDVESDKVDDIAGAVLADSSRDSERSDYDQQRLVDRLYCTGDSERYEHCGA